MTALTIVQDVAQRVNLPSPNTIQSSDPQVIQLTALATKEGEWLSAQYDWQSLLIQNTFLTNATQQTQAQLSVVAPNYKKILNDIMWNRDLRRPVYGPMTPQRYQQVQAAVFAGPWNQFIIQGDNINFFPIPAAGQTIAFMYITKNFCTSSSGTGQSRFMADSDILLLREDLFKLGVEWRWKKAKGLDYAQDFVDYETLLADAKAQDGTKDIINMGSARYDIYPGVLVPSGSWPIGS